jgi:hypothetical protein
MTFEQDFIIILFNYLSYFLFDLVYPFAVQCIPKIDFLTHLIVYSESYFLYLFYFIPILTKIIRNIFCLLKLVIGKLWC